MPAPQQPDNADLVRKDREFTETVTNYLIDRFSFDDHKAFRMSVELVGNLWKTVKEENHASA